MGTGNHGAASLSSRTQGPVKGDSRSETGLPGAAAEDNGYECPGETGAATTCIEVIRSAQMPASFTREWFQLKRRSKGGRAANSSGPFPEIT